MEQLKIKDLNEKNNLYDLHVSDDIRVHYNV